MASTVTCALLILALGTDAAAAAAATTRAPAPAAAAAVIVTPQAAAASNPLFESGPFPKWDKIKAEHVQPAVSQLIAEESASLDLLEQDLAKALKDGTLTFDRAFLPFTQMRLRLDSVYGQIDHLSGVMDSSALRKAVEAISPARVAFELRLGQSKAIYNALNALDTVPALNSKLSPRQQRLLKLTLRDYRNSGVGLDLEKRKRFNAIMDRLQKLSTNYNNNILDDTKAFKLLVEDKQQVDGLENSTLSVAAQKAKDAGQKNATMEKGPWLLTVDFSTYSAVMSFAKDRELRKKIYKAYRGLASRGKVDNGPIILEILALRKEMAQMLGYPNYAEDSFSSKMATFAKANQLLDEVTKDARPAAIREDQQLTSFAHQQTGDQQLQLEWWDRSYWSERQKEKLFQFRQEELKQYLPLDSVRHGLFQLAKRLYGVDVQPAKGDFPVWQKDVKVYAVYNEGSSQPIAYFYADFFARPGQKQGGAWVQPFWDRAKYRRAASPAAVQASKQGTLGKHVADSSSSSNSSSGNKSTPAVAWSQSLSDETASWLASAPMGVPLALLVTNQDPPAEGKPSLMTMDQAHTLFHEFGHALQHMLTTSPDGLTSGIRSIEWDAVETPSQMQEKWVYDNKTFNSFAKHWKTGEPVPASMFDKIKQLEKYRAGNSFTYQLVLGETDLQLHSTFDPKGQTTPMQLYQENYKKIMPYQAYPGDAMLDNFGHIFSGGYGAGYYSYMWADVMSADLFTAFLEVGPDNVAAVQKLGRRFRDTVLSDGGSVHPAQVFRDFRGRDPLVQPLLKYNGLI